MLCKHTKTIILKLIHTLIANSIIHTYNSIFDVTLYPPLYSENLEGTESNDHPEDEHGEEDQDEECILIRSDFPRIII